MLDRTTPIRSDSPAPSHPSPSAPAAAGGWPAQPFDHLDALWIQVAGTLCNLACTHCFVSCGPGNLRHGLMSRAEVAGRVAEARALGVREFYLTGGEPFLHPELIGILGDTLEAGPCTVLTNGTLLTRDRVAALRRLSDGARFSLEVRVSLDGLTAEDHDRFRGGGAFARTLDGLRRLEAAGLLPIVTVTQTPDEDPLAFRDRALERLRAQGLRRPRLKVIPLFRFGREAARSRGYGAAESLRGIAQSEIAPGLLQCGSSRAVTARGVHVCPLLVDEPGGRMGSTLAESARPFALRHGACFTCFVTGMTCGNG
jgi:sulfatase maturation enzyme AslB (radical SAM superfamily)